MRLHACVYARVRVACVCACVRACVCVGGICEGVLLNHSLALIPLRQAASLTQLRAGLSDSEPQGPPSLLITTPGLQDAIATSSLLNGGLNSGVYVASPLPY